MFITNIEYNMLMAYKYPALKSIANWVRSGKLPKEIEWEEVYAYWVKHHTPKYPNQKPWKDKPRFYNRALTANARAKRHGDSGKITSDDLEVVWLSAKGACSKCGTTQHLVFDHVVPYYRGGTNTLTNLQLLCRLCNMEKGVG